MGVGSCRRRALAGDFDVLIRQKSEQCDRHGEYVTKDPSTDAFE